MCVTKYSQNHINCKPTREHTKHQRSSVKFVRKSSLKSRIWQCTASGICPSTCQCVRSATAGSTVERSTGTTWQLRTRITRTCVRCAARGWVPALHCVTICARTSHASAPRYARCAAKRSWTCATCATIWRYTPRRPASTAVRSVARWSVTSAPWRCTCAPTPGINRYSARCATRRSPRKRTCVYICACTAVPGRTRVPSAARRSHNAQHSSYTCATIRASVRTRVACAVKVLLVGHILMVTWRHISLICSSVCNLQVQM